MGQAVVSELAVEDLQCQQERLPYYASAIMARMQERWVSNEVAELRAQMQRMRPDEDKEAYMSTFADLTALEKYRRSLNERANAYGEFTFGN